MDRASTPAFDPDLLDNRERRWIGVFVIAAGFPAEDSGLAAVEEELDAVGAALRADPLLGMRTELAVIRCNGSTASAERPLAETHRPSAILRSGRAASVAEGLRQALELLERRRLQCRQHGIDLAPSWLGLCGAVSAKKASAQWAEIEALQRAGVLQFVHLLPRGGAAGTPSSGRPRWRLVRVLDAETRAAMALGDPLADSRCGSRLRRGPVAVRLRGGDRIIEVGEALHARACANLYSVAGDAQLAVEIFHRPQAATWPDIERSVGLQSSSCGEGGFGLSVPIDVVLDVRGARVGVALPRIAGASMLPEIYCRRLRVRRSTQESMRERTRIALALARAVAAVHSRGWSIGGLDECRVFVDSAGVVWLTGGGSFHLTCSLRAEHHEDDVQSLATLVHALLLDGAHPFDAIVTKPSLPASRRERQQMGLWPGDCDGLIPPPGVAIDAVGTGLRDLWRRTLSVSPVDCPTAADWVDAVAEHLTMLVPCTRVAEHWRRGDLGWCQGCENS
jgi:hypothetical protein